MTENERPILICYDGSDGARRAIAAAGRLLSARRAIVVDVGPGHERYSGLYVPAEPHTAPDNTDVAFERATAGAAEARRAGFDAVPRSDVVSETWQGVVAYAAQVDAALIVIGSDGRDALSHEVAAHAGRPVLVVRRPRAAS